MRPSVPWLLAGVALALDHFDDAACTADSACSETKTQNTRDDITLMQISLKENTQRTQRVVGSNGAGQSAVVASSLVRSALQKEPNQWRGHGTGVAVSTNASMEFVPDVKPPNHDVPREVGALDAFMQTSGERNGSLDLPSNRTLNGRRWRGKKWVGGGKNEMGMSGDMLSATPTMTTSASAFTNSLASRFYDTYTRLNGLFPAQDGGYHSYRIPSLVHMGDGHLIAFAEGRVRSVLDWGDIDIVYRKSKDNGETWSNIEVLFGSNDTDTWGNPTTVYEEPSGDLSNGRLHVFFNTHPGEALSVHDLSRGDRRTLYVYSDDKGEHFSSFADLTETLRTNRLVDAWDAVGPGTGIVKIFEPSRGAIVIPATGRNFVSIDHGKTWHIEMVPSSGPILTGEATVVECGDGSLWRNDRATFDSWVNDKTRWTSRNTNGTFPAPRPFEHLPDPLCEASIIRLPIPGKDVALFLNSESPVIRYNMTPKLIYDCGKGDIISGPQLYVDTPPDYFTPVEALFSFRGGYSSMALTEDHKIGALVEVVDTFTGKRGHASIDFHKFSFDFMAGSR